MPPRVGRLWNVATGSFVIPLSEWVCLLPGIDISGLFHSEAFQPGIIIEIHISLSETIGSDPNACVCHM